MVNIVQSGNATMVVFENPNMKELNLLNECRQIAGGNRKTALEQGKAQYDAFWDLEVKEQPVPEIVAEQLSLDI